MRQSGDKHYCPLLNHDVLWGGCGGCVEVQEVREDNMDMELFPEPFELENANAVCEKCRWCYVKEWE